MVHRPIISAYSLPPNSVWVLRQLGRDRCPTWRRHLSNLAAAPVQVGRDGRPTWTIPLPKLGAFNHQAGRAAFICHVPLTIQTMRNKLGMSESLFYALENEWHSRLPTSPRGALPPAFRGVLRKDASRSRPACGHGQIPPAPSNGSTKKRGIWMRLLDPSSLARSPGSSLARSLCVRSLDALPSRPCPGSRQEAGRAAARGYRARE